MEKTVLVTGATGHLGCEVAKAVTARSTISPARKPVTFDEFVNADITYWR